MEAEKLDQRNTTRNVQLTKEKEMQDVSADIRRKHFCIPKDFLKCMFRLDIEQKEKTSAIFQGGDRGEETIRTGITAQRRIRRSSVRSLSGG